MPRRREVPKRKILPDPKFKSEEVAKFINVLMTRGKKSVAERIMYGALDQIQKKSGKDPFEVFGAARASSSAPSHASSTHSSAARSAGAVYSGGAPKGEPSATRATAVACCAPLGR